MSYQVGIDAGTTYTAAAIHREGRVEIVALGDRAATIPSIVFLKEDGSFLTGDAAARRGLVEPERMAREFKRRVGDTTSMLLGGTPHSAESLMARMLRWTVDKVAEREGEEPESVALTRPANWGAFKLERFDQAIRLADLEGATTLTEPEAAAIYYASHERVEPGSVIAVYDLGGGTFDAAVLRKTETEWEILGTPQGIEQLGGIDFDEAVFGHVRRALPDAFASLDPNDAATVAAVGRLRSEAVDAKEALSADTDVSIPVLLRDVHTEVRLTRGEFEAMIRPTLQDTVATMRRALRSADVEPDDVTAVLLVGGSSRIPLVAQLVSAEFGRPVAVDTHPKYAVALGAALAAGRVQSLPFGSVTVETSPEPEEQRVSAPPVAEPDAQADDEAALGTEPEADAADAAEMEPAAEPEAEPAAATGDATEEGVEPDEDTRAQPPADGQGRRSRVLLGAAAAVVVAVGAIVGLQAVGGSGDGSGPSTTTTAGVTTSTTPPPLDVELTVGRRLPVGGFPDGIAVDQSGRLWVAATRAAEVARIDPVSDERRTVALADGSDPLAVEVTDDGGVWVSLRTRGEVVRLDPDSLEVTNTVSVGGRPATFAEGAGTLWVGATPESVGRIDPGSGEVVASIPLATAAGIAVSDGTAWVTGGREATTLTEIDADTNQPVRTIQVGERPDSVVVDDDGILWVTNRGEGTVSRVDPATEEVTELTVGTSPADIVIDGDRIWHTDPAEGKLVLIDRHRVEVAAEIAVGEGPLDLVVLGDSVWVSVTASNEVVEVLVEPRG